MDSWELLFFPFSFFFFAFFAFLCFPFSSPFFFLLFRPCWNFEARIFSEVTAGKISVPEHPFLYDSDCLGLLTGGRCQTCKITATTGWLECRTPGAEGPKSRKVVVGPVPS